MTDHLKPQPPGLPMCRQQHGGVDLEAAAGFIGHIASRAQVDDRIRPAQQQAAGFFREGLVRKRLKCCQKVTCNLHIHDDIG